MRITIFGATGETGQHVLKQSLDARHEVTAVVRDPTRITQLHPQLTVVGANVMDSASIAPHLAGRDAVISTIGSRSGRAPTDVCTRSTTKIIRAMGDAGVHRLLVVSNSGMSTDGDGPVNRLVIKPILRVLLHHVWNDMANMEDVVRASDLDWTIVRPPKLTNGDRTAAYRTAVEGNVRGGFRVSRADLADCLLHCLNDAATVRATLSIAN